MNAALTSKITQKKKKKKKDSIKSEKNAFLKRGGSHIHTFYRGPIEVLISKSQCKIYRIWNTIRFYM